MQATTTKPEREVPATWRMDEWLSKLKRGDLVAVRNWTMGPYDGIFKVDRVGKEMVILEDGRRFSKATGFAIDSGVDGHWLITYPTTKATKVQPTKK